MTVSVVVPDTPALTAWIVLVPATTAVANPAALMVALAVFDEDQVAVLVRSLVLLSLNEPVAVNCCVLPAWIEAAAGLIVIDIRASTPFSGAELFFPHLARIRAVNAYLIARGFTTIRIIASCWIEIAILFPTWLVRKRRADRLNGQCPRSYAYTRRT